MAGDRQSRVKSIKQSIADTHERAARAGLQAGKELGALDGAPAGLTTVVLVLLLGQTRVG
jgi:tetrahydromethanopterin S-methyltransferase subunit G